MRWVVLAIGIVPPVAVVLIRRAVIHSRRRRVTEASAALAEGTLDPAKFVIGEGSYCNLQTTRPISTSGSIASIRRGCPCCKSS